MPNQNVKQELQDLRDHLQAIDDAEGMTPERIKHLLQHVDDALSNFDETAQQDSLLHRLRDSIAEFEAENPRLSQQINTLIQALVNAGL